MTPGSVGLVADIGRVSTRFALSGGPDGIAPRDVREFDTHAFPTFTSALIAYLDAVGRRDEVMESVIAISGITRSNVIKVIGTRWYIALSGIEAVLRAPSGAVNDFAANAAALAMLPESALQAMPGPAPRAPAIGGNYVALGPGTGLGVAGLVSAGSALNPIASEAGHIGFRPTNDAERRLVEHAARSGVRHIVAETMLSAAGLVAAYAALGGKGDTLRAEDVTRRQHDDPVARAAVALFLGMLGAFAGDMALAFGAWDGVFLIGAMARALQPAIAGSDFRRRFEEKGDLAPLLRKVPAAIVMRPQLELLGAATILHKASATPDR